MIKKKFILILLIFAGLLPTIFFIKKAGLFQKSVYYRDQHGNLTEVAIGQEIGIKQTNTQLDIVTGLLTETDDVVKGTHKLVRGADDFSVYLTSSAIDLEQFIGRGIEARGQTFARDEVGWFMDVLQLKLIK